jgi:hypothetical protein
MEVLVKTPMPTSSRYRLVISTATATAALALCALMVFPGLAGALGSYVAPHSMSSDPLVNGPWSGYGVRSTVAAQPITLMAGTWIQPGINCPTVGYASEVIAVGLDHYGSRIDGVGTLVVCVLGSPVYFAWVDQAPAVATILPLAVHVGDRFQANISTTTYTLTDLTTVTSVSAPWTGSLSIALGRNSAECIVTRGPTLGLLAPIFNPLPTSSPTNLTDRVLFGSLYTSALGCAYMDFATGGFNGLGTLPAPYVGYTFHLNNPPPAGSVIAPLPLTTGSLPLDSFIVP